jgi:hypothetical protein
MNTKRAGNSSGTIIHLDISFGARCPFISGNINVTFWLAGDKVYIASWMFDLWKIVITIFTRQYDAYIAILVHDYYLEVYNYATFKGISRCKLTNINWRTSQALELSYYLILIGLTVRQLKRNLSWVKTAWGRSASIYFLNMRC